MGIALPSEAGCQLTDLGRVGLDPARNIDLGRGDKDYSLVTARSNALIRRVSTPSTLRAGRVMRIHPIRRLN